HSVLSSLVGAALLDEIGDFTIARMVRGHRLNDDLIARVGILPPTPADHVLDEPIAVRARWILLEEGLGLDHRHRRDGVLVSALVAAAPGARDGATHEQHER